jgi:hypothetical protein
MGRGKGLGRSSVSPHHHLLPLTAHTPRVTASAVDDDDVVVVTAATIARPQTRRWPLVYPSACQHPPSTRVSTTPHLVTASPHLTTVVTTPTDDGHVTVVVVTAVGPPQPPRWVYHHPTPVLCPVCIPRPLLIHLRGATEVTPTTHGLTAVSRSLHLPGCRVRHCRPNQLHPLVRTPCPHLHLPTTGATRHPIGCHVTAPPYLIRARRPPLSPRTTTRAGRLTRSLARG